MNALRRHLATLLPAALIVAVAGIIVWQSDEAWQVAKEAVVLVFTFFTTPFVLETTVAILGLSAVLMVNQRRLEKDGEGWVEMEVPVKTPAGVEDSSVRD